MLIPVSLVAAKGNLVHPYTDLKVIHLQGESASIHSNPYTDLKVIHLQGESASIHSNPQLLHLQKQVGVVLSS